MAKTYLGDLSQTAASNTDFAGNGIAGSDNVSGGDNVIRAFGAMVAQWLADNNGTLAAGGTATAVTVTTNQAWAAYGSSANQILNGTTLALKISAAATGAATLNVNTIGTKKIRREGDSAIQANDWLANATVLLRYDSAYDTAAGAWVLLNANVDSSTFLTTTAAAAGYSAKGAGSNRRLATIFPENNEFTGTNYAALDLRNGHPIAVFPDAVVAVFIATVDLPQDYAGGNIIVDIDWMCSTTSTNKACFGVYFERMDVGTTDFDSDSFDTETIDTTGVAANATSGIKSRTSITCSTVDSAVGGDQIRVKIARETGQANDTNAGDIQVTRIKLREA